MKRIILLLPAFVVFFLWNAAAFDVHSSATGSNLELNHPVVVELFTSQGCSSCPPADRFLNDLSMNSNVITLSCHVTYWDSLGWKDPLSREFCTKRQRASSAQRKARNVFTPEMLVNGKRSFVGSRRGQIGKALETTQYIQKIDIMNLNSGQSVLARLPDLPKDGFLTYTIWVFGTKKDHYQKIERGENRGKTINYMRSVIALDKYAGWNGKSEAREIKIPQNNTIDSLTIIAQAHGHGPIVAAGELSIR